MNADEPVSELIALRGDGTRASEIERDRSAIAAQLVEPIARCVKRRNTNHVVFHGCIDWHLSVHGIGQRGVAAAVAKWRAPEVLEAAEHTFDCGRREAILQGLSASAGGPARPG